jgi:hypothetical protein
VHEPRKSFRFAAANRSDAEAADEPKKSSRKRDIKE